MKTNNKQYVEIFVWKKNTWNYLTVWKQIINSTLKNSCEKEILENINCVKTNNKQYVEIFMWEKNTLNYLTVWKQIINST